MRIRHTLATVALGGVIALGAMSVPAQATSADAEITAPRTVAEEPTQKYDSYVTLGECKSVGANGELHGRWLAWKCVKALRWELWVRYS
ncbi:hypothetical protein [Streptomyces rugosispiralis]|uniref:Secreted protein n=1 Tax=Streptomyces rugosispiralis TaxID=2967341 RepID=A0ABT1VED3_9ACTN|nr:hypothetical protein [Streptomyces rugosispiralis]MCQ8195149.1 hypothetical protein [Streptomyces rugosispiralis]